MDVQGIFRFARRQTEGAAYSTFHFYLYVPVRHTQLYLSFCITAGFFTPPASKVIIEVANLTERKKTHTPVYDIKESVCLSVCYQIRPQIYQDWQNRMG